MFFIAKTSSLRSDENGSLFIWKGRDSDNKKRAQSVNTLGPGKA
jgi:hypothetical protein